MNREIIYIRTEKGERSLVDRSELPPGLDKILEVIDGKSPLAELVARLDSASAGVIDVGLAALVENDLIRDVSEVPAAGSAAAVAEEHARKAQELRDKIRDRRKGDRSRSSPAIDAWYKARREAEERARREAEEHARRQAEEAAKRTAAEFARREAEEQARQAAVEQARRAGEEAKRAAEEQAKRAAEEQARQAAAAEARRRDEERARQEAEEQARRDAERVRKEAEEKAERERKEAEERAWRAAEAEAKAAEDAARETDERARQRAEVQARLMAEEKAWLEAEEKTRREEEAARQREEGPSGAASGGAARSGRPLNLAKLGGIGAGALLVAGLAAIHVISFDGQIPAFEQALGGQFQQPVKIKALHVALVPTPHLRFEGVSIGAAGQIQAPTVKASGALGSLFGDKKSFKGIELAAPVISEEGLGWILFGRRQARDVPFGEVSAVGATLESKRVSLPAFDARMQFDESGAWKSISLATADKNLEAQLAAKGATAEVEIRARSFKLPFGSTLTLEDFTANGTADKGGLSLSEFKGFLFGGTLGGNARLTWGDAWTLSGEATARQIDTARLIPDLMSSARLEGKANYAMQSTDATRLFDSARVEGAFAIPRGTMLGVDLGSVLQGGAIRGETKFSELAGSFVHEQGATQLRQLRLSQGNMSAAGSADVDPEKKIRGRLAAELRLSTEMRRSSLSFSGTPSKLDWQR